MTEFSCFKTKSGESTIALKLICSKDAASWIKKQDKMTQRWLADLGIVGDAGQSALVPDAKGSAQYAVSFISDLAEPTAYGHLPQLLPKQAYRCDPSDLNASQLQALYLGWGLGAYRFSRYLKQSRVMARLQLPSKKHDLQLVFDLLSASYRVRDMVNTPSEHMGPQDIQDIIASLAKQHKAKLKVIAGDDLLKQNFPAIHAVGRASHRAPRLVELRWGKKEHPLLAVVGKGVTFDTGGLDLQPADGMRNMKKHMGGSAHAVALAQLIMEQKLPVQLVLLVPTVENAIGPNSYRPGEVIATRQGLSIEIDNTDAEGRVILCDALTYAAEFKPSLIMDFATLTGAARIALGPDLPALFSNNDQIANNYLRCGQEHRDPLWRMPLWRPYLSYLKSGIADLANSGASRMAGCVTAALYLERFVPEKQDWTHVDVYSWNDSDKPGKPAGGEAQGLRAAFGLVQKFAAGKHTK